MNLKNDLANQHFRSTQIKTGITIIHEVLQKLQRLQFIGTPVVLVTYFFSSCFCFNFSSSSFTLFISSFVCLGVLVLDNSVDGQLSC